MTPTVENYKFHFPYGKIIEPTSWSFDEGDYFFMPESLDAASICFGKPTVENGAETVKALSITLPRDAQTIRTIARALQELAFTIENS